MALLRVDGLSVGLARGGAMVPLVDRASFDLEPGEMLGLVGESGSGKTITCRAMMRLLPAAATRVTGGAVHFDGQDLVQSSEAELVAVRGRKIAMIFQNPLSHLNPVMTIGDQIAEPLRRIEGLSRRAAREETKALLQQVGIPDPASRLGDYPHQFSGGMRQRVMIAGALACRPKLLIADEPTTALDVTVQAQILRLLVDLRDRTGLAIVLITHDLGVVGETCDRLAVMYAGRVVERGRVAAVMREPQHPYTQRLLASQPRNGRAGEKLPSIPGQPPAPGEIISGCRFRPRCHMACDRCETEAPELRDVPNGGVSACLRAVPAMAAVA
jgi:peptide/nickel transport system ATP-binding protein